MCVETVVSCNVFVYIHVDVSFDVLEMFMSLTLSKRVLRFLFPLLLALWLDGWDLGVLLCCFDGVW